MQFIQDKINSKKYIMGKYLGSGGFANCYQFIQLQTHYYINQLINCVLYLHNHCIIHRDIKLGNIMLNDKLQIKLGDFGLSTKIKSNQQKYTVCGTPNYIAPQILDQHRGHSYQVDNWAIGVILYTMLVGKPPFESSTVQKTYQNIKELRYKIPESLNLSMAAKDLIRRLLVSQPSKRIKLRQIKDHIFFTGSKIPEKISLSTLAIPPKQDITLQLDQGKQICKSQSNQNEKSFEEYSQQNKFKFNSIDFESNLKSLSKNNKMIYVKKNVYIQKKGVGYLLSNGSIGIILPSQQSYITPFPYIYILPKCQSQQIAMIIKNHLQFFQSIYSQFQLRSLSENFQKEIFVRKYVVTQQFLLFRLSNDVIQVEFKDGSILSIDGLKPKRALFQNKVDIFFQD